MIYLKKVCPEDLEKEWLFVRDMPEDENGVTNEWHGVSREVFEAKTLPQMLFFAEGKGLPEGYVPETIFFLWDDDTIVGQVRGISASSSPRLSGAKATEPKACA